MRKKVHSVKGLIAIVILSFISVSFSQIVTRFPYEKKVVTDPVTGTQLTFLTSTPKGDSEIYQTHNQRTSDSKWVIFRSNRVQGEAMAVPFQEEWLKRKYDK